MASILVDYENVSSTNGLRGVEYLNENDTLILFYSQSCEKIRSDYIESIEKSCCEFKIRKLVKTGKNALDFYIASECGYISQSGEEQIVIISNDKGFSAVADYFHMNSEIQNVTVILAGNIENALLKLKAPEDTVRRKLLQEKTKSLNIESEYIRMQERMVIRKRILSAFKGTEYEKMSAQILDYLQEYKGNVPKLLYTGSLHKFGRNDGRAIYNILKNSNYLEQELEAL